MLLTPHCKLFTRLSFAGNGTTEQLCMHTRPNLTLRSGQWCWRRPSRPSSGGSPLVTPFAAPPLQTTMYMSTSMLSVRIPNWTNAVRYLCQAFVLLHTRDINKDQMRWMKWVNWLHVSMFVRRWFKWWRDILRACTRAQTSSLIGKPSVVRTGPSCVGSYLGARCPYVWGRSDRSIWTQKWWVCTRVHVQAHMFGFCVFVHLLSSCT